MLEIQFLGGAGEVGRSAFLLKDSKNILLDYGMKINSETMYPMLPGRVDACIISHAHLDHCGCAPLLYYESLPVTFGTEPTAPLSELLIEDSMSIRKRQHEKPKFVKRQLKTFLEKFISYGHGTEFEFDGYSITLYDAGHIPGSAITYIEKSATGRRIAYTGDFKIAPQLLQGSADIVESDVLIIESTYATRDHPNRNELIKKFVEEVKTTLDNGGTALVPCFAVGRSQEMLAILYQHGLMDYVYIDGMARKATEIIMRYPEFIRNKEILIKALKKTRWVGDRNDRFSALSVPGVIVTTAGMLNGGPVLDYITQLNSNSRIFLTGYQVEGTNGRKLLEGKPIVINGRKHQINNTVTYFDFSAHADRNDLYEYVRRSGPETVFCVHGDSENSTAFAESLKLEGFKASAPKIGDRVKIDF